MVDAQPVQSGVHAVEDIRPRQTTVVRGHPVHGPGRFGGQHDIAPFARINPEPFPSTRSELPEASFYRLAVSQKVAPSSRARSRMRKDWSLPTQDLSPRSG